MTRYRAFSIMALAVLVVGIVLVSVRVVTAHTGHVRIPASVTTTTTPVPMATMVTGSAAHGTARTDDDPAAFTPSCDSFESTARAECVYDESVDQWAYVGAYDGNADCWQITDGDGNGVILCPNGYGIMVHA